MNIKYLTLAAITILALQGGFAIAGPGEGGGGAGICVGDTCMTLAEAGLRINAPQPNVNPYCQLSPKLATATKNYLHSIPDFEYPSSIDSYLMHEILGTGSTYVCVDIVDPTKLAMLKKQYADLMRQNGSPIDPNTLVIFAYSQEARTVCGHNGFPCTAYPAVTYLLPDFFALNQPKLQAKILLHEDHIRLNGSLKDALEFDGMVEDLFKNSDLPLSASFRLDRWTALTTEYKEADTKILSSIWMARYYHSQGVLFELSKFGDNNYPSDGIDVNVDLIRENYAVDPDFLNVVSWSHPFVCVDRFTSVASFLDAAEIKSACQKHMTPDKTARFFFPYKRDQSFTLADIQCSGASGSIQFEAYLTQ